MKFAVGEMQTSSYVLVGKHQKSFFIAAIYSLISLLPRF